LSEPSYPIKTTSFVAPLMLREDMPRQAASDYWAGPHGEIVKRSLPGVVRVRPAPLLAHRPQVVEAGSGGKVTIVVSVEGEDAKRLQRIANERGQHVDQVVADLVRQA